MSGPVRLLADTQIVIWYFTDPERLTASATRAIEEATGRDEAVGVLAFALVEMIYAVEKTTNPLTEEDFEAIVRVLSDPESPLEVIPLDAAIAERVRAGPGGAATTERGSGRSSCGRHSGGARSVAHHR